MKISDKKMTSKNKGQKYEKSLKKIQNGKSHGNLFVTDSY